MTLKDKLKKANVKIAKFQGPVWKGPEIDGFTNSLLSRFLVCRERFRLRVVHGLKQTTRFEHRLEYGNMWHVCEECHARGVDWQEPLKTYCRKLAGEYRLQAEEVDKWYNVCKVQFPLYVEYWSKSAVAKGRKPLLEEEVFRVPYKLPSGRVVWLRGKFDSVDLIGKFFWLQENKSKSEIDEGELVAQLKFDCQTMMYLVALRILLRLAEEGTELDSEDILPCDAHWGNLVYPSGAKIAGVRYNVIRRPLSGGLGNIKRHQATQGAKCPKCKGTKLVDENQCPKCRGMGRINAKPEETKEEYYGRLADIIKEDSFDTKGKPKKDSTFFARFDCQVGDGDIDRFEQRYLVPISEQLCDWWKAMEQCNYDPWANPFNPALSMGGGVLCHNPDSNDNGPYNSAIHWQTPYGFYNPLAEGNRTDLDECLANGSEVGLQRTTNLFPELTEVT